MLSFIWMIISMDWTFWIIGITWYLITRSADAPNNEWREEYLLWEMEYDYKD